MGVISRSLSGVLTEPVLTDDGMFSDKAMGGDGASELQRRMAAAQQEMAALQKLE